MSTAKEFNFRVLRAREIMTHSLARGVVGAVLELAVVYGEKAEKIVCMHVYQQPRPAAEQCACQ